MPSESSESDADRLDELEKGDRFRVDCHDETLRVHCAGPYGGPIVCDAYDENGAQWPVAEVNGQLYLGWSQTTPADEQTRAKEIGSVTIVDDGLRADGGPEQTGDDHLGWICIRCKKIVSTRPFGTCSDCGGEFRPANEEDRACDRCQDALGKRLLDRTGEFDRLCESCIEALGLREDEGLRSDGGVEPSGNPRCPNCGEEQTDRLSQDLSSLAICSNEGCRVREFWENRSVDPEDGRGD